jgi:SM-20-related protein
VYEQLIQELLEKGFGSVDNWFSDDEIMDLRKELLSRYRVDDFELAGIGNMFNHQTTTAVRSDHILWLDRLVEKQAEKVFFAKVQDFINHLNRTCYTGIRESEFHYAVYEPEAFFKRHKDQFANDDRRKFSFVLYLTNNWLIGDGGELVLYQKENTIIQPKAGTVIFFDSTIEHEVMPSKTLRLSLAGWLKTS